LQEIPGSGGCRLGRLSRQLLPGLPSRRWASSSTCRRNRAASFSPSSTNRSRSSSPSRRTRAASASISAANCAMRSVIACCMEAASARSFSASASSRAISSRRVWKNREAGRASR